MRKFKRLFSKPLSGLKGKKVSKISVADEAKQVDDNVRSKMYNLIIIDESGSMQCIQPQVVTGCNETLQTIRNVAEKYPNQEQYVSIYFFDTDSTKSRYVLRDKPINEVKNLEQRDYRPNGMTPLYDAMGTTITELRQKIDGKEETYAMVTVITDGYENASREYSGEDIKQLVETCKEKNWVFTFIGANVDSRKEARKLNISNSMQFHQTEEGTRQMFCADAVCRDTYYGQFEKRRRMSLEERKSFFAKMNESFFDDDKMDE